MKITLIIFSLALIATAPIIIISSKYFDGSFTDSSYYKGLDYDKSKNISQSFIVEWEKVICAEGECSVNFTLFPPLDENTLKLKVSRPIKGNNLVSALQYSDGVWSAVFKKDGSGFYNFRLEFMQDGILIDKEESVTL